MMVGSLGNVMTRLLDVRLQDVGSGGISPGNLHLEGASQANLVITFPSETYHMVDTLDIAQVYLSVTAQETDPRRSLQA